jgi:hypothetical protein
MTKYELFYERKCACCGKKFIPTAQWTYKEWYGEKLKWFCKYTCMLKYRESHKPRQKRRVEL